MKLKNQTRKSRSEFKKSKKIRGFKALFLVFSGFFCLLKVTSVHAVVPTSVEDAEANVVAEVKLEKALLSSEHSATIAQQMMASGDRPEKKARIFVDLAKSSPAVAGKLKEVYDQLPEDIKQLVQAQAEKFSNNLGIRDLLEKAPQPLTPRTDEEHRFNQLTEILRKDDLNQLKCFIGERDLPTFTVSEDNGVLLGQRLEGVPTRKANLLELAVCFKAKECVKYLFMFQRMPIGIQELCVACCSGDLELIRTMWDRLPHEVKDVKTTRLSLIDAAITGRNETVLQWLLDDAIWEGASLSQEDIQYVFALAAGMNGWHTGALNVLDYSSSRGFAVLNAGRRWGSSVATAIFGRNESHFPAKVDEPTTLFVRAGQSFEEALSCTGLAQKPSASAITAIWGEIPRDGCKHLCNLRYADFSSSSEKHLKEEAFQRVFSLEKVVLPAGMTSIGNYAFSGCSSLKLTSLPAGLTSIGNYAFLGCRSLALESLPAGLISIGHCAFFCCSSLALRSLPAGLTRIGDGAFCDCTSLALESLPAGLTSIGHYAFSGCISLKLTSLPAGLTSIGGWRLLLL